MYYCYLLLLAYNDRIVIKIYLYKYEKWNIPVGSFWSRFPFVRRWFGSGEKVKWPDLYPSWHEMSIQVPALSPAHRFSFPQSHERQLDFNFQLQLDSCHAVQSTISPAANTSIPITSIPLARARVIGCLSALTSVDFLSDFRTFGPVTHTDVSFFIRRASSDLGITSGGLVPAVVKHNTPYKLYNSNSW